MKRLKTIEKEGSRDFSGGRVFFELFESFENCLCLKHFQKFANMFYIKKNKFFSTLKTSFEKGGSRDFPGGRVLFYVKF